MVILPVFVNLNFMLMVMDLYELCFCQSAHDFSCLMILFLIEYLRWTSSTHGGLVSIYFRFLRDDLDFFSSKSDYLIHL